MTSSCDRAPGHPAATHSSCAARVASISASSRASGEACRSTARSRRSSANGTGHGMCQNPAVADLDELKIPKAIRSVAEDIILITDEACAQLLDAEYADLARRAVAKLARKRPSPLLSGRHGTWAAAVVYALGQVNFLFDASSEPHLSTDELSAAFGVAKSTMSSKAKQVRDLLKMDHFATEFMRADVMAESSMVWFIEVDGLVMDSRSLPIEYQVAAFQRGYIPYIPALGPEGTAAAIRASTDQP
jgi:hypothetical protein